MSAPSSPLANVLSLLRPCLGAAVFFTLTARGETTFVVPVVMLAAGSDWLDGQLARRAGAESRSGRLLDNACDFFFLLLMFAAFANVELWSPPVWGRLVRHWPNANRLPVYALLSSFGSYAVRVALDLRAGREPARSSRGHTAGIVNYLLVFAGAVDLWPGLRLGPWILEPAVVSAAMLNFAAVGENLLLMFPRRGAAPRMRP